MINPETVFSQKPHVLSSAEDTLSVPKSNEDIDDLAVRAAMSIIDGSSSEHDDSLGQLKKTVVASGLLLYESAHNNPDSYIATIIEKVSQEHGVDLITAQSIAFGIFKDEVENKGINFTMSTADWVLENAIYGVNSPNIEETYQSVTTLWSIAEQYAESEHLSSKISSDKTLMAILKAARAAATHKISATQCEALDFYESAELAYLNDFKAARIILARMTKSPKLKDILEERLTAAEEHTQLGPSMLDERSKENLKRYGVKETEDVTSEQLEEAGLNITIGASIKTLEGMLADPYGRYLSVHEHATSGGFDLSSSTYSNQSYINLRLEAEVSLGHESNVFLPRPVYGSLTSDLQLNRSSGYGVVTLYPLKRIMSDPATTFSFGDTLDRSGRPSRVVPKKQLNIGDAKSAYAFLVGEFVQERASVPYIEAHVPGLHLKDLEKVSILYEEGTIDNLSKVVNRALERQVPVEVTLSFDWRFEWYILNKIKEGFSEEEACQSFIGAIKETFDKDPNLSFVFNLGVGENNRHVATMEKIGIKVNKPICR